MASTDERTRSAGRLLDPSGPRFALQLAILSFVVVVHSDMRRAVVGAILATVGLLVGNLIENRWYWWAVATLMTGWFFLEWPVLDNHVALSVYWAIAVAIALSTKDWPPTLAVTGRWSIVTVFALAVFWKLVSPDFLSGDFFEWTLLVDPRFSPIAQVLGVSGDALVANRELVAIGQTGTLVSSGLVQTAAMVLTIGTMIVESAVGFLWALGERAGNLRHWALAAFAIITYVMVPVAGFGFMLLVIAVATVNTYEARRNYAVGAAALFVYSVIWNAVVL